MTFNGTTTTNLSLTYDSLGNILSKYEAGSHDLPVAQTIAWTSYNYPASITATTTGETATFSYGPDRQRWKMVFSAGSTTETTYYIGGLMEKVITGSLTDYRHYIKVGDETIAIYSRTSTNQNTVRYILSDHQGSIDTVASSSATRVLDESFTAFGLRRNAATWSGEPSPSDRALADGITRQGYTFQTVLGRMGLNHMNGRVQDAIIGRFVSPDPFVTEPGYTQNFNRYSYVYNNPLTNTDPSGFESCTVQGSTASYQANGTSNNGSAPSESECEKINEMIVEARRLALEGFYGDSIWMQFGGALADARSTVSGTRAPLADGAESSWSPLSLFGISTANAAENSRRGLIHWETDPSNPFAASPAFTKRFSGSPEELALATTIVMINAGSLQVREVLGAMDLALPGGRKALFDIYSVGPPDNPGPGRIANVRGTNIYYYSPYHYRPGPDVPNTWIKITYPAPTRR